VLPTRPSRSIYGVESTVLETPRTVSQVSTSQLREDPIRTYDDFVRYAPGITRSTGQNVQGSPLIRGNSAEVFRNGQRVYTRQTDHPLNLNAYESADIVSGPASVVLGPGNATGGFVNYTTKRPYFDQFRTQITGLAGTWVPSTGESYRNLNWQIDHGGPISQDLAYRLSYQQQNGDTYWENVRNNYYSFFGALAYKPQSNFRVDWNVSYDNYYDFNETKGWNRATNDLVRDGTYNAGRATPIISNTGVGLWSPVFASGAANSAINGWQLRVPNSSKQLIATGPVRTTPLPSANPTTPGTILGWVYDPNIPGNDLTKIKGSQGLANPADNFNADEFNTQLLVAYDVSDKFSIENKAYFQKTTNRKDTLNSYWVDIDDTLFDDRLELRWKTVIPFFGLNIEDDSNSGASIRHEQNSTRVSVFKFVVSPYDLSQPASTQSLSALLGGNFPPAPGSTLRSSFGYLNILPTIPIGDGLYSEPGGGNFPANGAVADSEWQSYGLFTAHNLKFTERWGLNLGARVTAVDAKISNPLPLNPSLDFNDEKTYLLPSYNASLYFKPTPLSNIYVTYDRSDSINPGGFGSALSYGAGTGPTGAGTGFRNQNFHSLSELFEAGAKAELIPARLFGSLAGYLQYRDSAPDQFGTTSRQEIHGVEASLRYQASQHFSIGGNYTYLKATFERLSPQGFSPRGFVADNATVFQDNNVLNQVPAGEYEVTGLPDHSFNGYVDYQLDSGLGATLYAWVTSAYPAHFNRVATIPTEHSIDLALYYKQPNWDARLQFLNVTDEQNFAPVIGMLSEFLQPMQRFAVQAQLSLRF
jgi:hypothetical protein